MKKANKFFAILMLVILATPMFNSCKKGADDPFISFKSRDGRLTSTWKLTKIDQTESDVTTVSSTSNTVNTTITFDGSTETKTTVTKIGSGNPVTTTTTSVYTFEMTLDKLGVASYKMTVPPNSYTGNGTWAWGSNSKNKDMVTLVFNGNGGFFNKTYNVDQLKSKELILKVNTEETSASANSSDSKKVDCTYTFEKQ